jgi:YHS domain-containing protein
MRLHDVHSRFEQVHLRTREERAVYFTLVAQLAESWSAVEIASLKDLDVRTVEAVLDRYADAGVVDVVDSATGLRYRWCSDMSYLFGGGSSAVTMIDPVCGMTIAGGTPHWLEDGSGTLWLFCSSICLATFRTKSPNLSVGAENPVRRGGGGAKLYGPVVERPDDL